MDSFDPPDVQYVFSQSYEDTDRQDPLTSAFPSQPSSFAMPALEVPGSRAPTAPSRQVDTKAPRSRHRGLKWDDFKVVLKKLYLEENNTLEEIRQRMLIENSFEATSKQYKDKFKTWGWQKNLPVEKAQFMVVKAIERKKAPRHKDTIFEFGGLSWTKERAEATVKRAKKELPESLDAATPQDIVYRTPINCDATSPEAALTNNVRIEDAMEIDTISTSSPANEWESDSEDGSDSPLLIWDGKTRADVYSQFLSGQHHARNGNKETAEDLLKGAAKGHVKLLGPTHDETVKVAFALSEFYVENDRLANAYEVLEKSCRTFLEKFGMRHRRTQQHFTDVVALLHGWNKEDDALAFLARVKEMTSSTTYHTARGGRSRHRRRNHSNPPASHDTAVIKVTRAISQSNNVDELDYGVSVARTHARAKDDTVEHLLVKIIERCSLNPIDTAVQSLKSWAELLKIYQRSGRVRDKYDSFVTAHNTFFEIIRNYPWELPGREKFKSLRVVEAAAELTAAFVMADHLGPANRMFSVCTDKANGTFGGDDERTIWLLISIGLVYQRYKSWDMAKTWFEQALARALLKYDENDGIRISLEEAFEVNHFSYINDEGRPFKTIFGVSGLKIMPTRLHLE